MISKQLLFYYVNAEKIDTLKFETMFNHLMQGLVFYHFSLWIWEVSLFANILAVEYLISTTFTWPQIWLTGIIMICLHAT